MHGATRTVRRMAYATTLVAMGKWRTYQECRNSLCGTQRRSQRHLRDDRAPPRGSQGRQGKQRKSFMELPIQITQETDALASSALSDRGSMAQGQVQAQTSSLKAGHAPATSRGETPKCCLNIRLKCEGDSKPQAYAISCICMRC
jgi:hypothetical protein